MGANVQDAAVSDAQAVAATLNGDVNAFETLLTRHSPCVLSIVKRHTPHEDVEEVAHEVFIRAFRSLPKLKDPNKFKAWVSSIAAKTCCDFWRRRYKSREAPMTALSREHHDWMDQISAECSLEIFEQSCRQKEAREVLDHALSHLSPKDRMVLELVHLEGYSCREAAGMLEWSTANVKIRCHRARKKLAKVVNRLAAR